MPVAINYIAMHCNEIFYFYPLGLLWTTNRAPLLIILEATSAASY